MTPLPTAGDSIEVYWSLEKADFPGVVKSVDSDNEHHTVHYEDGEIEKLDMCQETWRYNNDNTLSASVAELSSNLVNAQK